MGTVNFKTVDTLQSIYGETAETYGVPEEDLSEMLDARIEEAQKCLDGIAVGNGDNLIYSRPELTIKKENGYYEGIQVYPEGIVVIELAGVIIDEYSYSLDLDEVNDLIEILKEDIDNLYDDIVDLYEVDEEVLPTKDEIIGWIEDLSTSHDQITKEVEKCFEQNFTEWSQGWTQSPINKESEG